MEKSSLPAFRSASLPNPTLQLNTCSTPPIATRSSHAMPAKGPITPPLSPGASDHGDPPSDEPMQGVEQPSAQPIPVDTASQPTQSQPEGTMEVDQQDSLSSAPPARALEDEQSHVHRGGSLSLTDFEVKGTLGEQPSNVMSHNTMNLDAPRHLRDRNLRSCTPRSTARLSTSVISELLRDESPPEDGNCPLATS